MAKFSPRSNVATTSTLCLLLHIVPCRIVPSSQVEKKLGQRWIAYVSETYQFAKITALVEKYFVNERYLRSKTLYYSKAYLDYTSFWSSHLIFERLDDQSCCCVFVVFVVTSLLSENTVSRQGSLSKMR